MAVRQSVMLDPEQKNDLEEFMKSADDDCDGQLNLSELGAALEVVGIKMPQYQVRELMKTLDTDNNEKLSMEEFEKVYANCKEQNDFGRVFKKAVSKRKDIQTTGGHSEGTTHTIKDTERYAFSSWINKNLENDPDCKDLLPINPDSDDLFTKVKDGILLCKLINNSVENTIDERTINKKKPLSVYLCVENLNLALNSAQAIGCNVVNIGHGDLKEGKPHLVLGLLWQIIRIGLLSEINLSENPDLVALLREGETIEDLLRLSPEEILIRWVNYQLDLANESSKHISNFSGDIKDSEVYIILLNQIAPKDRGLDTTASLESDLTRRANLMLDMAEKIDCRAFISASDVVNGNSKLNLAFVANLFNTYPNLHPQQNTDLEDIKDETREEKTYRNWMNSMGVSPYVNRLYTDLHDGIIFFQLYDIIQPGSVNWDHVKRTFRKMAATYEKIGNCNYAIELGKQLKFSIVGTDGKDIFDGNESLTLGLVWQLMRAYTIAMLKKVSDDGTPLTDAHILGWANTKLKECGKKYSVANFQDSNLRDSTIILHLIDCIVPKKVNFDNVKTTGSDSDLMLNAKYAISMGRKIGARIYALPEDIVELKQKMIMTIFACLMTCDWNRNKKDDEN